MNPDGLVATLESPLPAALTAGTALAVYCSGTAWAAGGPVSGLELLVDGVPRPLEAAAMPRFDMPIRRSGFWGVIPVRAAAGADAVELAVRATGHDPVLVGRIPVNTAASTAQLPPHGAADPAERADGDPLVAICMATFDPDPEMLAAQLQSIRAQADPRWCCVISDDCSSPERFAGLVRLVGDDERFTVSRSQERIGFYRNFERALMLAPADAPLLALCDQDDVWHPDKLGVLRGSLGSAMLVYSDQRLVDEQGRLLRETMWRGRANNWTNLGSLLIANTVTGAAAMMRREVAERALPFPDSPGIEFHDHWLALVALASGELAYVPRALYDYVQHPAAILGKVASPADEGAARRRLVPRMREWRAAYFLGYIPGKVRAATLLMRCGEDLTPAKRRALRRYLSSDRSAFSLAWLLARPLRAARGRTETLAGEWELTPGIAWRRLAGLLAGLPGWPERLLLDASFPNPARFEQRRLRRWRSRV